MLRFNDYVVDLARGCLRTADDHEIDLRPKSFEVLRYLAASGGRLVTKDELLKALWPGVVVSDESLVQCVSEVRRAIGDPAQAIIKTVPRRGYRFVAPVSATPAGPAATRQAVATSPCVAVLPFANMSGDPGQDWLCDGVSEDVITELSRFAELVVIARNSSFQFRGQTVDTREVGARLGARYVLEGSLRRQGEQVRVTAQLV